MGNRSNSPLVGAVIDIIELAVLIAGFIWQRHFMPLVGAGDMEWWQGLLHGSYVLPNFIGNFFSANESVEIFQSGAGNWYTFWFLLGSGVFFNSGRSLSSR